MSFASASTAVKFIAAVGEVGAAPRPLGFGRGRLEGLLDADLDEHGEEALGVMVALEDPLLLQQLQERRDCLVWKPPAAAAARSCSRRCWLAVSSRPIFVSASGVVARSPGPMSPPAVWKPAAPRPRPASSFTLRHEHVSNLLGQLLVVELREEVVVHRVVVGLRGDALHDEVIREPLEVLRLQQHLLLWACRNVVVCSSNAAQLYSGVLNDPRQLRMEMP